MTHKQKEAFRALKTKHEAFREAVANYRRTDNDLRQCHQTLCRAIKNEKLKLVYRLRNLEKQSLEDVGKRLGVTRERIRQIEEKINEFFISNL